MIDSVYQTVQGRLNKEQLGYLKPMLFNLFAKLAQRKIYNDYFTDLKSQVRKQNWKLDGKHFADMPKHTQQLIEHYSQEKEITSSTKPPSFTIPSDVEFIEDIYYSKIIKEAEEKLATEQGDVKEFIIEVISFSDFNRLKRNRYAPPSEKNPYASKVNTAIKILPDTISKIKLHYLRKPIDPKWTYYESASVAFFDPTANDYQDFDLPETSFDALVSLITELASESLRDNVGVQAANQEQVQDLQENNRE